MSYKSTSRTKHLMNKVPEVTIAFWLIKIMATTVGETGADFLIFNMHLGLGTTSWLMGILLLGILFLQMRAHRYIPTPYWLSVVMISIVGTLITDNLTDNYGVPLAVSTGVFSIALAAFFALWYAREKNLSIKEINTPTREAYYWIAILITFALGTAAGDWVAESLNFGYLISAILFGGMIAAVALAHYVFRMNAVLAFWLAYILTRPFGASCGDFLSQPHASGGLGFGTINTSAIFLLIIAILVGYLSLQSITQREP